MSRPRRPHLRPLAAINVTPLVDVMLVLLIIFMVTAALDRGGIPVNLPSASAPPLTPEATTIMVTVDRDGHLFLNHTLVAKDRLATELQALGNRDSTLVFRADQEVPYGTFVEVVGLIRAAGIERLTIETAAPAPSPP